MGEDLQAHEPFRPEEELAGAIPIEIREPDNSNANELPQDGNEGQQPEQFDTVHVAVTSDETAAEPPQTASTPPVAHEPGDIYVNEDGRVVRREAANVIIGKDTYPLEKDLRGDESDLERIRAEERSRMYSDSKGPYVQPHDDYYVGGGDLERRGLYIEKRYTEDEALMAADIMKQGFERRNYRVLSSEAGHGNHLEREYDFRIKDVYRLNPEYFKGMPTEEFVEIADKAEELLHKVNYSNNRYEHFITALETLEFKLKRGWDWSQPVSNSARGLVPAEGKLNARYIKSMIALKPKGLSEEFFSKEDLEAQAEELTNVMQADDKKAQTRAYIEAARRFRDAFELQSEKLEQEYAQLQANIAGRGKTDHRIEKIPTE